MNPKKNSVLPYLLASLGLIVVAIFFSAILNRTRDTQTSSTDIRARANVPSLVKVIATVVSYNETDGTLTVDNVRFQDATKNLGEWTVTPPAGFRATSVFPGSNVTITVDPPTMLAEKKTLTATEIKITR